MPTSQIVRTLVIFGVTLAVLLGLYALAFQGGTTLLPVTSGTATVSAWVLKLLGQSVQIDGIVVRSDQFAYRVVEECTAITPAIIYAAAVLAFPADWQSKARGVALGVAALFALNIVRIVSLYFIGVLAPDRVEFFHLFVWQLGLVLAALGLWIAWAGGLRARQPA